MPAQINRGFQRLELPSADFIFGSTEKMRRIRERIEQAANDDLPVLIEGESGTGKEVTGRYLHQKSMREDEPFLKIHCGVTSSRLLDSPVATACKSGKNGPVSHAFAGTLYLDGIDMMESSLQRTVAAAIRSSQEQIEGGSGTDVTKRFICSTSIDLAANPRNHIVDELQGCFAHRVHLLPLRERTEDIPRLCEYLIEKLACDFGRPVPQLSPLAVEMFQQWKWPGNIRELENWIARIVVFGAEEVLGIEPRKASAVGDGFAQRYHRGAGVNSVRARRPRGH